ncbi:Integral membrane protein TerC family protein [Roseovarius gaetbuli]|uniref:Integral membrane protein TerC family protein n=1 Tax=Roseovarius gaetbuli TaxID=1356575 RepID=A0A1X6YZX9_9RHOB|nr:TerC family protein [Roseovarius gaetbuli]SLN36231.1 Integral membrane protein TerC family protein [Roseovarius gaetbuli]
MITLLSDPAVWAAFLTLTVLEIVLGIDNVIFISIAAARLPEEHRARARLIGLSGALLLRIILLFFIAKLIGLSEPFVTLRGWGISWRDVILVLGGLFLIYKASTEIFDEVEGEAPAHGEATLARVTLSAVIVQIMLLDLVFSIDSVITAVGIADHIEVMIAAICVAIVVMMIAATPISNFVEAHPSTKMLALAFLLMVGMALVADGFHFHVERGFIYAAMLFGGGVEALNLLRQKRRRARAD